MIELFLYKLRIAWYYIEVWFAKFTNYINIKKDTGCIPDGWYCYKYDIDKNEKEPIDGYWIKTCKYYRGMKSQCYAGCTYVGFIGFDACLGDQCKICDVNVEYLSTEELEDELESN